jgi:hypothetical protein
VSTRRGWFWGLFGLGSIAQAERVCKMNTDPKSKLFGFTECRDINTAVPAWKGGVALNNQCPVCETLADQRVFEDMEHHVCIADHGSMPCPLTVTSMITRCRRCNAAFFQDESK